MTRSGVIAYFGSPHLGGTYTVYRLLRDGLRRHGLTVRWLALGAEAQARLDRQAWQGALDSGMTIAPHSRDEREQGVALLEHLESGAYDAVFVNVLADRVQTNAMRYLDASVIRIMIAHNITPGTYAAARSIRDHVHAAVGVSPRICDDLVGKLRFRPDRTFAIPNAIDIERFERAERAPSAAGLRILSLGRVEDSSKGIFWLPRILAKLEQAPVALTVAGDGPDLTELKRRCASLACPVTFLGPVPLDMVAGIMARHDVFLFPSRFEGLGIALAEAMAAGCVPVASRIHGVTDFVIAEGKTGFLVPVGDTAAAAQAILLLARDRERLARMAAAARSSALARFRIEAMAAAYAQVLERVWSATPDIAPPLRLDAWRIPRGLRPGLRTALPAPVKNTLRLLRERARP
jgi:glycosyltransferase involved in cell wall biosynthesis